MTRPACTTGLAADGFAVADLGLRGPTLDEAFLALTGQHPVGRAAP